GQGRVHRPQRRHRVGSTVVLLVLFASPISGAWLGHSSPGPADEIRPVDGPGDHVVRRRQIMRCALRPAAPTAVSTGMLRSSWNADPRASRQLENASDTPTSAAAGMVVTEMNTPMRALALASVRDTTPTSPARMATMTEYMLGVLMRFET